MAKDEKRKNLKKMCGRAGKTVEAEVKKGGFLENSKALKVRDEIESVDEVDKFEETQESDELKEINARIRELNVKFFKLHKKWFLTQKKGLHLPVEHLKASFKESEFTNFLGEIFGGVFCKTRAIEEKMDELKAELEAIDEDIKEVNDEIKALNQRRDEIIKNR